MSNNSIAKTSAERSSSVRENTNGAGYFFPVHQAKAGARASSVAAESSRTMHIKLTSEKPGWNSPDSAEDAAEPNSTRHSRLVPLASLRRSTNSAICFSASIQLLPVGLIPKAPGRSHHEPLAPPPPQLPPPNPPKPPPAPPTPPPPPHPLRVRVPPPPSNDPKKTPNTPHPPNRTKMARNTRTPTNPPRIPHRGGKPPLGPGY